MITIDANAATQSVQLMYYSSEESRWYTNNVLGSELTAAAYYFADMKLYPGTQSY